MINSKTINNLSLYELGFILTVLRDNCLNDKTYAYLDKFVKELIEKQT